MRSQSFLEMRRRNALTIVSIVRSQGDISRAELAREANLSPATVSSIVDDLLSSGILVETGSKSTATQRGRRPIGLTFNARSRFAAGASIDGASLRIALCDLDGNPVTETKTRFEAAGDTDELTSLVADSLKEIAKEAGIPVKRICALGVSLPATSDQVGWDKILPSGKRGLSFAQRELWSRLQKKLKRSIIIDSHVNMAAVAESNTGTAMRSESVMVIRMGNVLRSALIVNGTLQEGSSRLAGEIGHVPAPGLTRICECGSTGCINTVATPASMVRMCKDRGVQVKGIDELIAEAANGNNACRDVLGEAAKAIGFAIAVCVNMLAPNQIIISGPITEASDLFMVPMYSTIRKHAVKANLQGCTIMTSELKQRAEPLGAALKAIATEPRLLLFGTPSEISIDEDQYAQG